MSRGSFSTEDLVLNPIYSTKEQARSFSDEYSLGVSLGTGTYTEVFLCVHKATGYQRSAKFYRTKLHALTKGSQEALIAEINIMLSLKHPNLMETIEFFQDSRSIILISEYCQGGSLLDRLTTHNRFTERQAASVMKQLCYAVKNLHKNKIMLRSITPDAIRFRTKEVDSRLKIVRFTNAMKFTPNEVFTEKVGPLFFMSPEMLEGTYNELCDEWNLGVLMYQMLTGVLPFEASRPEKVIEKIKQRNYSTSKGVWMRLSNEAKELVNFLLAPVHKRMTADTALYHPWLQRYNDSSEPETPAQDESKCEALDRLDESLKSISRKSKSKPSDLAQLKEAIAQKDPLHTGNLHMNDLVGIVREKRFSLLSVRDMEDAIQAVGADGAGYLQYEKVVRNLEESKHVFSRQSDALIQLEPRARSQTDDMVQVLKVIDISKVNFAKRMSQQLFTPPI